jgi:methylthioribose-1-phosphate isomerase
MKPLAKPSFRAVEWVGNTDGHLLLLDQTRLPSDVVFLECRDVDTVWEAIKTLRVRGAPAIGIAGAYGLCLGLRSEDSMSEDQWFARLNAVADRMITSRPTAVNLAWAVRRVRDVALALRGGGSLEEIEAAMLAEARAIEDEDREMCRSIGRHGASLLANCDNVLTHCNAGGLATSEYGTALAVIFSAVEAGKRLHVWVDETRPLLQGSRLTAWELVQQGISATLICDSMAAQVMREGRVQAVVVGADRIAANGDTANKIGTYGLAQLAAAHGIPFYVAAPTSTFDLSLASGDAIPIEQRDAREITHVFGSPTAPAGVAVYNPAFDVTPARLIRAIVCERGVISPVTTDAIARCAGLRAK